VVVSVSVRVKPAAVPTVHRLLPESLAVRSGHSLVVEVTGAMVGAPGAVGS
jgi:hypothetical protein